MLVQERRPLERCTRGPWNAMTSVGAIVLVLAVSGLRLEVGAAPTEEPAPAAKNEARTEKKAGETVSYSGKVIEQGTGKPIVGATVTVRRLLWPDPESGGKRVLQETRHRSDAEGKYRFTIPPEQLARPHLGIVLYVEHPDYPPEDAYYYEFGNIRENENLGDRPSFEVELRPGKPITGVVEMPDGKPAAGVLVQSFSYFSPEAKPGFLVIGSHADTRTDDQGRFRLVVITPGEVAIKLYTEQYAVSVHELKKNQRGDLGRFVLKKGLSLTGKVLDTDGKALAGLIVNAAGFPEEPVKDEVFGDSQWGDMMTSYSRSAVTDAKGAFAMAPLPPGFYRLVPVENDNDPLMGETFRPLPAPFTSRKVVLKEGETPGPIEIRALPHVVVEAQVLDSKGQTRTGASLTLGGQVGGKPLGILPELGKLMRPGPLPDFQLDGESWSGWGSPGANGKIVFHAPRGLGYASIGLFGFWQDDHTAVRHRIRKDAPLLNSDSVDLGSIDSDRKGLEIIVYESPTVLVKVAAKDGSKPKGARVTALYPEAKAPDEDKIDPEDGQRLKANFTEQEDGRFRSQRLLPDETVTFTAQADGFAPRSETLKLPEGATKVLELILEAK